MSADSSSNGGGGGGGGNGDGNPRNRRSSITQAAFTNLFQRGPTSSTSGPPFSGQGNPTVTDPRARRLSVTTLGLSGASTNGASALGIRRGSMSTNSNNSDSIDESVVEDDDVAGARTAPTTPFTRRMSFGGAAMRGYRPGGSPGNGNDPSPPPPHLARRSSQTQYRGSMAQVPGANVSAALAGRRASIAMPASSLSQASNTKQAKHPSDSTSRSDQQGFNWSDQLRSRAENNIAGGPRASFSMAGSPPRTQAPLHDRAKSVSDMPAPPAQAAAAKATPARPKPDAFQERILKGDFYMD